MTKQPKKPKKLLMIGLDGLMMEHIRKFVDEGRMPTMERLMKRGS
jgi:predicted AlkP superfamily phosphohydrolase/phosphomutase